MQVTPVAVVADTNVLDERSASPFHRHSQGLRPLRCGDDTAVTIGLFQETLVLLNPYLVGTVEFLVPLDGAKVGGGEQDIHLTWAVIFVVCCSLSRAHSQVYGYRPPS